MGDGRGGSGVLVGVSVQHGAALGAGSPGFEGLLKNNFKRTRVYSGSFFSQSRLHEQERQPLRPWQSWFFAAFSRFCFQ